METMLDGIKLVKVMCVDPNGVWAMVRISGYPHSMPYVVHVKELSQPTKRAADGAVLCPHGKFSPDVCSECGESSIPPRR